MNSQADGAKPAVWRMILVALLWALSAVLSVVMIPTTLDAVTRIFAAFWGDGGVFGRDYWNIVMIRQLLTAVMAVLPWPSSSEAPNTTCVPSTRSARGSS